MLQLALLAAQTPAGATWLEGEGVLQALTALAARALGAQAGALAPMSSVHLRLQVTGGGGAWARTGQPLSSVAMPTASTA